MQENRGCVRAVWSNGHWYTRCEVAYRSGGSTYNHSVFSYRRLDRVWINYMNARYRTGAGYGSVTGCHRSSETPQRRKTSVRRGRRRVLPCSVRRALAERALPILGVPVDLVPRAPAALPEGNLPGPLRHLEF